MAAPSPPTVGPVGPTEKDYQLVLELSQAQRASIDATPDFLLELGDIAIAGFASSSIKVTISRLPPVPPS